MNHIQIPLSSADKVIISLLEDLIKLSTYGRLVFMTVSRKTSMEVIVLSMPTGKR